MTLCHDNLSYTLKCGVISTLLYSHINNITTFTNWIRTLLDNNNMNIHNLSKADLLTLKYELTQYKLGNITTEQLSPELTEILNAVKQITN